MEWSSANDHSLLYDPMETDSLHSSHWNSGTNPDLVFVGSGKNQQTPVCHVLWKFPQSQHQPSLVTSAPLVAPTSSRPMKRWNFQKADWVRFQQITDQSTSSLPTPDSTGLDFSYMAYCDMLISVAKKSIPRGYQRNYIPCNIHTYK